MKGLVTGLIIFLGFCRAAAGSEWYLIRVQPSPLHNAVAVYRVETTLIQIMSNSVSLWVKTDFLRPKSYIYPKEPRMGNFIQTDAYLWQKERYIVHCGLQQIDITDASYMLAEEFIEWDSSSKVSSTRVSPDSIFEDMYKLSCSNSEVREKQDIQRRAEIKERAILPDPKEQEQIRKEENVPRVPI